MKNFRTLFFCFLILSQLNLFAQDTIKINFNNKYHLLGDDSYSFKKAIDNHSNQIYYEGKLQEITFPNQFFVTDTAVAFEYFTGWGNPKIEKTTALLLGNYTSESPVLYVDYNHNLDFSDDGQPLKFGLDSTVMVYFKNSEVPSSYFPIEYSYPKIGSEQKEYMESIFSKTGPDVEGNNIVSVDYWLGAKRMNYKITDSWLSGRNIKIGLFDYNCNGLYNDEGEDRILIGNYEENSISDRKGEGAFVFSKNVQLLIANEIYEITEIEPSGNFIKLVKSNRAYIKSLGIGDQVSDLEIKLLAGEIRAIKDLQTKGNFILLDFWGTWCRGCTKELPLLKELKGKHADQLQVIGLNYADDIPAITKYLAKHKIEWLNGFASDRIMEELNVDIFPSYLLIDPNGKILLMNGTLEQIEKLIH